MTPEQEMAFGLQWAKMARQEGHRPTPRDAPIIYKGGPAATGLRQSIINELKQSDLTAGEITRITKNNAPSVCTALSRMEEAGIVKKMGRRASDKRIVWSLA